MSSEVCTPKFLKDMMVKGQVSNYHIIAVWFQMVQGGEELLPGCTWDWSDLENVRKLREYLTLPLGFMDTSKLKPGSWMSFGVAAYLQWKLGEAREGGVDRHCCGRNENVVNLE